MAYSSSVVAEIPTDFSPEDLIGPARVHEDHRQHEERSDQQEGLRTWRGRRFPEREAVRDDHGPEADGKAEVREQEQQDCDGEWRCVLRASERAPFPDADRDGQE